MKISKTSPWATFLVFIDKIKIAKRKRKTPLIDENKPF